MRKIWKTTENGLYLQLGNSLKSSRMINYFNMILRLGFVLVWITIFSACQKEELIVPRTSADSATVTAPDSDNDHQMRGKTGGLDEHARDSGFNPDGDDEGVTDRDDDDGDLDGEDPTVTDRDGDNGDLDGEDPTVTDRDDDDGDMDGENDISSGNQLGISGTDPEPDDDDGTN